MTRYVLAVWLAGTLLATGLIAMKLISDERSMFLPGESTSGHYQIELACESCHTPWGGVEASACLACHKAELDVAEDSHPPAKFTDPRNADRLELLDARSCLACHVEHRPDLAGEMGVTLPDDFCSYCHSPTGVDIAEERASHRGLTFDTCATSGCHNFHDNRALYEDFLLENAGQPDTLAQPRLPVRQIPSPEGPRLLSGDHDAPDAPDPLLLEDWASTRHAIAAVNCSGCHRTELTGSEWSDAVDIGVCRSCHEREFAGFTGGRHGMRHEVGLSAMSGSSARLPMRPDASGRILDCASCHGAHGFGTRAAAFESCIGCHADEHSQAYELSPHFSLWQAELRGEAATGTGVSCATCHLPGEVRREGGRDVIGIQHNQNDNLRPNEKMIRGVCMNCHGLGFSIDALADPELIESNFDGPPRNHVPSIDMAVERVSVLSRK